MTGRIYLAALPLLAVACSAGSGGPAPKGSNDETTTTTTSGDSAEAGGTEAETGSTSEGGDDGPGPGGKDCPNLSCLPCGNGMGCAAEGAPIDDTCCVEGDALVHLGQGGGLEVVDIESDGRWAFLCGGFGVTVVDVRDPDAPIAVNGTAPRCQRIGIGPLLADDVRVFYLAHHGDSWVKTPFLNTYYLTDDGDIAWVHAIEDSEVLFEGVLYHEGTLYAAAHVDGLRVYSTTPKGIPKFVTTVGGFENAIKLAVSGSTLYVANGAAGVRVLSLADPLAPEPVASVETLGIARDLDVEDDRLFVALGGTGAAVFDISDPHDPQQLGIVDPSGSVQAVSAEGGVVALAAWNHVAVYDVATFQLLATERVLPSPEFEQDLGVAMIGDIVHVGEWEGLHELRYRPGYVASDIGVQEDLYTFDAEVSDEQVVVVRNRGYLDLAVSSIAAEDAFSVDATELAVPPGEGRAFEVSYEAIESGASAQLTLISTDPDDSQNPLRIPLVASTTDNFIDEGDPLTDEFGFLDPNGNGQVSGLEGNVVVLAYFALF